MTAINLKRRVTVPFPANVTGAAGVAVTKANGLYTVKLDSAQLSQTTLITDGANQGLFLQNRQTGVTNFLGYTDFVTNVSGNLTVPNSSVTYAKIQNVAASRLLGNATGSSAVVAEIPLASTLVFSAGSLSTAALSGDVTATAGSFATTIAASAVTLGKMANLTGLSVIGNAGTASATPAATTGTTDQILRVSSAGTALGFGSINLAASAAVGSSILPGANGGTGTGTYIIGDLLQASSTSALARLAATAVGNVLISGGAATASSWGKVGLTTHVSGTLAEGNGGTNQATYTLGDLLYSSATNTLSKLAGNIVGTRKFLRQTGTGTVSAAPAWDTLLAADVPGSALTKTDDTNVTLTLGGTPASALLAAASVTAGWTGTLAVGRGGTGGGAASGALLDNISGFASTGFINRTGAGTYTFSSASGVLDGIGSTRGNILYRGAAGWSVLAPGASAGQVLQTGGAGADPSWATITGTGTVTGVGPDTGGKGIYSLIGGTYSASAAVTTAGTLGLTGITHPGGRLTAATGVAVMTSTVTGATSHFYTPYLSQFVPLWNGTVWVLTDIGASDLTQTLADTTKSPAAAAASSNYDVFVWSDAGTMRATRGPAWTSATARGTGVGTTELQMLNGIYTNKNAITNGPAANRGTYVGSFRTNGSATLDYQLGSAALGGGQALLYVWNMYNREQISTDVADTTGSWTQTTTTVGNLNASATNRISILSGLGEDGIAIDLFQRMTTAAALGAVQSAGIAMDSTSAYDRRCLVQSAAASTAVGSPSCSKKYLPQLGQHFFQALQAADGTNTATWNGNGTDQALGIIWRN